MGDDPAPTRRQAPLVQRRIEKVAGARSVTLGLSLTFLGLALVGAILIKIIDERDFSSYGSAFWWSLQTVTTVGYGDIVPTTRGGQIVGSLVMVFGVSFIALLTAGVTSTLIHRFDSTAQRLAKAQREQETQKILDALTETRGQITALDKRLDRIESKLPH